jgi:hypothetical protein
MANGKSIRHSPFARLKPCTASGELGHCVQERRKVPRDRTFLNGQIAFNNKNSIADCFVRNCSSEGAKIAVAETLPLPREFRFSDPRQTRKPACPACLAARGARWRDFRGLRQQNETFADRLSPRNRFRPAYDQLDRHCEFRPALGRPTLMDETGEGEFDALSRHLLPHAVEGIRGCGLSGCVR